MSRATPLAIILFLLTSSVLAALPRPMHALTIESTNVTVCSGDVVEVNLTVRNLVAQQLVVRVDLSAHETILHPSSTRFSVGGGTNLTRVVTAVLTPTVAPGSYPALVEVYLDDKPVVRVFQELPFTVVACSDDGPEDGIPFLTGAALLGIGVFGLLMAMVAVVMRVSRPDENQVQYGTYQEPYKGQGMYRQW